MRSAALIIPLHSPHPSCRKLVEYILAREQGGVDPAKAAAPRPTASVRQPDRPPQKPPAATPKPTVPAQSAIAQATANADEARNLENLRSLGLLDATYPLFIHCAGANGTARAAGAKRVRRAACGRVMSSAHGATMRVGRGCRPQVHFIRHGQGFHNVLADVCNELGVKTGHKGACMRGTRPRHAVARSADRPRVPLPGEAGFNPYDQPEYLDPPLTETGRQQAALLAARPRRYPTELRCRAPCAVAGAVAAADGKADECGVGGDVADGARDPNGEPGVRARRAAGAIPSRTRRRPRSCRLNRASCGPQCAE